MRDRTEYSMPYSVLLLLRTGQDNLPMSWELTNIDRPICWFVYGAYGDLTGMTSLVKLA